MPRTAKPTSPQTTRTTTQSRKAAARPRTPKPPALKKAEIEAMLLSAQKKLHDAETELEGQASELSSLREQVSTLDDALTETREKLYSTKVDVRLAQHQRDEARARACVATAETRHLTQLLVEAERRAESANTAQADKSKLDAAVKQVADLKAKLANAEDAARDVLTLRKRVSEQEQQLRERLREITDLTALLTESESREQDVQVLPLIQAAAYGKAAVSALITPPDTMRLDQERLNRAARALAASDVFDAEWYLDNNGDVAECGVDPSLHFLEFGFAEGRSPRPVPALADREWLSCTKPRLNPCTAMILRDQLSENIPDDRRGAPGVRMTTPDRAMDSIFMTNLVQ